MQLYHMFWWVEMNMELGEGGGGGKSVRIESFGAFPAFSEVKDVQGCFIKGEQKHTWSLSQK